MVFQDVSALARQGGAERRFERGGGGDWVHFANKRRRGFYRCALVAFEGAYLVRHLSRMNSLPRIVNLISARSDCVAPIYSVYTVYLLKGITYAR